MVVRTDAFSLWRTLGHLVPTSDKTLYHSEAFWLPRYIVPHTPSWWFQTREWPSFSLIASWWFRVISIQRLGICKQWPQWPSWMLSEIGPFLEDNKYSWNISLAIQPMLFCTWDTSQKCHFTLGFCILNFSIVGCPLGEIADAAMLIIHPVTTGQLKSVHQLHLSINCTTETLHVEIYLILMSAFTHKGSRVSMCNVFVLQLMQRRSQWTDFRQTYEFEAGRSGNRAGTHYLDHF
jgi:hypothetical protein